MPAEECAAEAWRPADAPTLKLPRADPDRERLGDEESLAAPNPA